MNTKQRLGVASTIAILSAAVLAVPAAALQLPKQLPDPDGKPADMSKPVQVYILMGQSNMLNFGSLQKLTAVVKGNKKYPYLVDDAGNWLARKDVRNVWVGGSGGPGRGGLKLNDWMQVKNMNVGVEFGIGHWVGHVTDAPVLILKSATGNRSLGWDLLPPGSKQYEFEDRGKTWIYAGHGDSPERWEKGTTPRKINWSAGIQYLGDIARAKDVMKDLGKYYPGATKYEVAGFFYWQGDKDRYNAGHATRYEKNLVNLIKALRKEFNAPNANFVCATLGQTRKGAGGNEGHILNAQLAVDGKTGKYPEFKGNVATFYTNPVSKGGASGGHYGGNPETYMNVGEGMGRAMAELILLNASTDKTKKKEKKAEKVTPPQPKVDPNVAKADKLYRMGRDAERFGQRGAAKTFLQRVVKDYPGTPAAERAEERLTKLK
jgi:hypothetical protein